MSGLSFLSVTTSSSSSVRVIISWDQLSDRSGCFKYQLNYVGVQPGIYNNSNATVVERSVELTSVEDMYMFSGLPDAQYLVQISAISCNLQLSSPEATTNGTTVPLRKSSGSLSIEGAGKLLPPLPPPPPKFTSLLANH